MKQDKQQSLAGSKTTPAEVCQWVQELFHLHNRLAPRFARPEPHRCALAYLKGILSDVARKNGWQLAEHAGEARPDGMQRLLSDAVWDTDGVRDDLRAYLQEHLGKKQRRWSSTKPRFSKAVITRLEWEHNIAAAQESWKTVR